MSQSNFIVFNSRNRDTNVYPYSTDCNVNFVNIECSKLYISRVLLFNSYYNVRNGYITQDAVPIIISSGFFIK